MKICNRVGFTCLAECFFFTVISLAQLSFCLSLSCASYSFAQSLKALEKNKHWLEYDQQREAYVRAVVDRILELEKQLREANQARSQQHNDDHSDGEPEGQWAADTHHWGNRLSQQGFFKLSRLCHSSLLRQKS